MSRYVNRIGIRLGEIRREQELTYEFVSFRTGLSIQTIKNIEEGKPAMLSSVEMLASLYGMSIAIREKPKLHLIAAPIGDNNVQQCR